MEAFPSDKQTGGGHLFHSLPPSPGAGSLAQSHSLDGHTSETAGFHHSCSSPIIKNTERLNKLEMDSMPLS